MERELRIPVGGAEVGGTLALPTGWSAVVAFAHGSGSGRHSPRNRAVAAHLQDAGLGTLLMDLLTEEEERIDTRTGELRFDIPLLAGRLADATRWLQRSEESAAAAVGYFGASTGAAAALVAAARPELGVRAVVSRGGRPDLAGDALPGVTAPTLLIVGGLDHPVVEMNREAMERMRAPVELRIVEGASHLFEERGKLEEVASLSSDWFLRHLGT
ncbi:MAG TPA: dienelactone hydrolase family protein [Actinomycetota bacterium]|nr:dienelactone hydrolase family protein [Actinomycetota bacterium]